MKVIWVSPDGNDSTGDGSQTNPYLTIAVARSVFVSDDQIRLAPGTYTPADTLYFSGVDGSLVSDLPGAAVIVPVLTMVKAGILITNATRFLVQGIKLKQATDPLNNTRGIEANTVTRLVLEYCFIDDFLVTNDDFYGVYVTNCAGYMRNCHVERIENTYGNIYIINAPAMDIFDSNISDITGTPTSIISLIAIDGGLTWLQLSSAIVDDFTHINLYFNKDLMVESATTDIANYAISGVGHPALTIVSASILSSTVVGLTVAGLVGEETYTVTVSNIRASDDSLLDSMHSSATCAVPILLKVTLAATTDSTHVAVTFNRAVKNNAALNSTANYQFSGYTVINPSAITVPAPPITSVSITTNTHRAHHNYLVELSNIVDTNDWPLDYRYVSVNYTTGAFLPRVSSVHATDSFTIHVVFNMDMQNNAALINAANYTVTGPTTVVVSSVAVLSTTEVALTVDWTDALGAYTVHVINVESIDGDVIDPAHDTAPFTGFEWYLTNLLAYYKFENNANDSSANAYNASLEKSAYPWNPESNIPTARRGHRLCYDSDRKVVVMFGGYGSAYLDETWEFDGTVWTQKFPANKPSGRTVGGMVYDSVNKKTVYFGGYTGTSHLQDTYLWDGTNWETLTLVAKPEIRREFSMVFDSARGVVVLFGGRNSAGPTYYNDIWEFNVATRVWTNPIANGAVGSPSKRFGSAMAFDSAANVCHIFGGTPDDNTALNDSWVYNGAAFTQKKTDGAAGNPPQRWVSEMVYNPITDRTILYGGYKKTGPVYYSDTWSWNWNAGTPAWTQLTPTHHSVGMYNYGLIYFADKQYIMFIGGFDGTNNLYHTWKYNDVDWQTLCRPTARRTTMVYDAANHVGVLFGGYDGTYYYDDTWLWHGDYWENVSPATGPSKRKGAQLSFDLGTGKVVLFGGNDGADIKETWEWDGSLKTWTSILTGADPGQPSGRWEHRMVYDAANSKTVLFGGYAGAVHLDDTWTYNGVAKTWNNDIPSGTPGSPAARSNHGLVWDSTRSRVVMFGGQNGGGRLNTMYDWNGAAWSAIVSTGTPTARADFGMSYDSTNNYIIVAEGSTGSYVTDTYKWAYNGGAPAWSLLSPIDYLSSRALEGAMIYDSVNKLMVAFGGYNGTTYYNDMKVFGHYPSGKLLRGVGFDGTGSTGSNTIGTRQSVLLPTSIDTAILAANAFTFIGWVKFHEIASATRSQEIIARRINDGSSHGSFHFGQFASSDKLFCTAFLGTSNATLNSSTSLLANYWYHVAATFSTTDYKVRIYLNGAIDGTSSAGSGNIKDDVANRTIIGASQYTLVTKRGDYFDGVADNFRIYSRALTTAEIVADFNKGVGFSW